MKLIIAGGRKYKFTDADIARLDNIAANHLITEVVHGGAMGADSEGRKWAISRGIRTRVFRADWNGYGRWAGPKRNREMAEYADAVVLFPGGRGTNNMHDEAIIAMLTIFDFRFA